MKLNFKNIHLKENSEHYKWLKEAREKAEKSGNATVHKMMNEFIIVGEETVEGVEHLKVKQLSEDGLKTFGLPIDMLSYSIPKDEFEWDGSLYSEIDIDKELLTVELIDDIKRLNE